MSQCNDSPDKAPILCRHASSQLCREGCVVYSLGSFFAFDFEYELLNRTACDIHVFDPTVLPSQLRQREAQLNAGLPRRRIWWHSIGIAGADNPQGRYERHPSSVMWPPTPRAHGTCRQALGAVLRKWHEFVTAAHKAATQFDL